MTDFRGITDRYARFVEAKQLLNREDWHLLVQQFKSASDDCDNGWRCEYFGKMMRGASVTYSYTKNEQLYNLLTDAAKEMLQTQDERGRFSTYSIANEFNGWDMWGRKYVLLGFLYYYDICRDEQLKKQIIAALEKHLDYIVEHVGRNIKEIYETSDAWKCVNSASILEPTLLMYRKTGKQSYLTFSEYIIDYLWNGEACIFRCAYENRLDPFEYPVTKAYEVMSCFEGLLVYYEMTHEEKYLNTVIRFADRLINSEITVIGDAGCFEENFNNAAKTQTDTDLTCIKQETCVTVTYMKLCHHLLLLTDNSKYADEMERSAYNALYGAVNTLECKSVRGEVFTFDSYSPLTLDRRNREVGGYKNITDSRHYGCCVAIGAHGTGMMPLYAVREHNRGITLDFYEIGRICTAGFEIDVDTAYPLCGAIRISILKAPNMQSEIKLRIPIFSENRAAVSVNGHETEISNGYAVISRQWRAGDTVELTLDMSPRVIKAIGVAGKPETKNFIAILYGPLCLARDKRLGEVGTPIRYCKDFKLETADASAFPCELMVTAKFGRNSVTLIDYMSAGRTLDDNSLTEAWLPVK